MSKVKLVIHCSDSSFGNASLITKWHVLERGWRMIGYHYVILNGYLKKGLFNGRYDGRVETGRALDGDEVVSREERGAHVFGYNSDSVGICLIGESGEFTDRQIFSLKSLLSELRDQFGNVDVFQHSDLDKKKRHCAGLSDELMSELRVVGSHGFDVLEKSMFNLF